MNRIMRIRRLYGLLRWLLLPVLLQPLSVAHAQQHEFLNLSAEVVDRFVGELRQGSARETDESPLAPVLIRAVNIVDPRSGEVSGPSDVLMANGQIIRVRPAVPTVGDGFEAIDGSDKYLLPGLVDSHVHLAPFMLRLMPLFPRSGVTSVINLSGSAGHLRLAQAIEQDALPLPTLYTSGPFLQGPSGMDGNAACTSAREHAAQGFIALKFYQEDMSEEAFRQFLRCAEELRLPIFGHLVDQSELLWLSEGRMIIAHAEELLNISWNGQQEWLADDQMRIEAARMLVQSGVSLIPNLALYQRIIEMMDDAKYAQMREAPEMSLMPYAIVNLYGDSNPYRRSSPSNRHAVMQRMQMNFRHLALFSKDFASVGGKLLVGSDAPNPMAIYGVSFHQELAALRQAGLSAHQVLQAATLTPWEILGESRRGVIEPGAVADLLLLEANPLTDLQTLNQPISIILRGQPYTYAMLQTVLEDLHASRMKSDG